jgi:hypothetical protein
MKWLLLMCLKLLAVSVVYLISFIIASSLLLPPVAAAASAGATFAALFLSSLLISAVISWLILRSRWSGWRLIAALSLSFYGVHTLISQIETAAFPAVAQRMPPGMLSGLFAMGILQTALYIPLAVLILGRWRPAPNSFTEANTRLVMPPGEWAWKLALAAVVYIGLYFTFGYYVAWRNPAVVAYYGGEDPGSLILQLRNVMGDTPWLPLLQLVRGIIWVLLALPVIRMLRGTTLEISLAVGLLFAVVMSAGLLLPNPFMPAEVRITHLVETATSNLLFGVLVGWLFSRSHTAVPPQRSPQPL